MILLCVWCGGCFVFECDGVVNGRVFVGQPCNCIPQFVSVVFVSVVFVIAVAV